jgi:hypothetical protein
VIELVATIAKTVDGGVLELGEGAGAFILVLVRVVHGISGVVSEVRLLAYIICAPAKRNDGR